MELKKVPELYKQFPFFDDGKYSPSRFYVATVVRIMTVEEAKKHTIILNEPDENDPARLKTSSLYDIWKNEVDECVSECVYPHDGTNHWCYAPETDCFVVCAIPEYDESLIYFARHINGGWFSFDTVSTWQCGKLDVNLEMFNRYQEDFPDVYNEYKHLF